VPADSAPSSALRRVAEQEQTRIARVRTRLQTRQRSLGEELQQLEDQLAELDDRERLLDQLLGPSDPAPAVSDSASASTSASPPLKGAKLRERAARLLFLTYGARVPVHYKDWFAMVAGEAEISGRDPLASFLTNAARSPVLSRGEAPGTYYIDPDALGRLRAELAERQAELRDLTEVTAREVSPSESLRAHRTQLLASIRHLETQVTEAEHVLEPPLAVDSVVREEAAGDDEPGGAQERRAA